MGDQQARATGGSRFRKALNAALSLYERPRVAVVATTPDRADWIRQICLETMDDAQDGLAMYVADEASDAMSKRESDVVVLDSSLPQALKDGLRDIARGRHPNCTVIIIRKWRREPPK